MEKKVILGPPGTGKTTRLLNIMENELQYIDSRKIAYVSFTKKAVSEALARALEKFGLKENQLPYFRTLHSFAYRMLNLSRGDVMGVKDWTEIGDLLQLRFTKRTMDDDLPPMKQEGDIFRYIESLAHATSQEPMQLLQTMGYTDINPNRFKQFLGTVTSYKRDMGMLDFPDMLENAMNAPPPDVIVAIIDEAQDLSTKQWALVDHLFKDVERLYIAGDDDQELYAWAGADIKRFLSLKGDIEVLHQSYRVPIAIQDVAQKICGRISNRYDKKWSARDAQGMMRRYQNINSVELDNGKSWFLLGRNGYMLKDLVALTKEKGMVYSTTGRPSSINRTHVSAINAYERLRKGKEINNAQLKDIYSFQPSIKREEMNGSDKKWALEDLEFSGSHEWYDFLIGIGHDTRTYYRRILEAGRKLSVTPKVHISTVHSVKGGEADCVLLLNDISPRMFSNAVLKRRFADAEHRVFYVGVTRAREELHFILPRSENSYDLL